ncbi:MAG: hypothetical protein ACRERU_04550 [Methylococcales bacterium]
MHQAPDASSNTNPAGITGEICVAARGVGRGCLKRPDLTAERFIPDPFAEQPGERLYRSGDLAFKNPDGELVLIGRTHHPVKLHGFRIEPGEMEARLLEVPGIDDAVVVTREDPACDRRLLAYLARAVENHEGVVTLLGDDKTSVQVARRIDA